jgi:hypothetical protein
MSRQTLTSAHIDALGEVSEMPQRRSASPETFSKPNPAHRAPR